MQVIKYSYLSVKISPIEHVQIKVISHHHMRWVRHVACNGDRGSAYRVLARRPEGKRPLERP